MPKLVVAYLATAVVFILMDGVWLTLAGPHLYRPALDPLLGDKIRIAPAIAFYALYIAGLVYFCVQPGLAEGWRKALVSGVILGLVAYGAYDLTCNAVMRVWSLKVTLGDMAWGAVASGGASVAGVLIVRAILGRTAG